jgi:hypothetical protein
LTLVGPVAFVIDLFYRIDKRADHWLVPRSYGHEVVDLGK